MEEYKNQREVLMYIYVTVIKDIFTFDELEVESADLLSKLGI